MKKNKIIIETILNKTIIYMPHIFGGYYDTKENKIKPIYHKKYYNRRNDYKPTKKQAKKLEKFCNDLLLAI